MILVGTGTVLQEAVRLVEEQDGLGAFRLLEGFGDLRLGLPHIHSQLYHSMPRHAAHKKGSPTEQGYYGANLR